MNNPGWWFKLCCWFHIINTIHCPSSFLFVSSLAVCCSFFFSVTSSEFHHAFPNNLTLLSKQWQYWINHSTYFGSFPSWISSLLSLLYFCGIFVIVGKSLGGSGCKFSIRFIWWEQFLSEVSSKWKQFLIMKEIWWPHCIMKLKVQKKSSYQNRQTIFFD